MDKELKRASFIRRLCAYVIDYLLVVLVVSIIAMPFTDTKKTEKLEKESTEIIEKYQKGEITPDEYLQRYSNVYYNLSRNTGIVTFITIIVYILYYVVFQLYNKGQTIGKKFMKIKVISIDGELSMNQMIFRSLIVNMLLLNIINFALITFAPKDIYTGVSATLSMIQYIIMFISIILATTKEGRTIHDRIVHTRVVSIK